MEMVSRYTQPNSIQLSLWTLTLGSSAWVQTKPHLGDDEAVINPPVGTGECLCQQHVLPISPSDENMVQEVPVSRLGVYPGRLLPHWEADKGAGQQETVFRIRSQKKEPVIVTVTETLGTQHSSPRGMICPFAGIEVSKDN
ncbi:unnamed protein product [Schistocephalus solidus]|uniref:Cytokine receptor-like factor 2 n=1 Tax=Schistocephalus solidus TaxID=70667 RepID=A0A183SFP9_SCHSO|nr:unnamed protein product [Schistocephalus solidus]